MASIVHIGRGNSLSVQKILHAGIIGFDAGVSAKKNLKIVKIISKLTFSFNGDN